MSETPSLVIVGYVPNAVANLWDYLDEPTPPRTHKTDEAIAKWRQNEGAEKRKRMLATASKGKITGRMEAIFAVDPTKKQVFDSRKLQKMIPSIGFAKWLLGNYPQAFPTYARSTDRRGVVVMGFDPKEFVRVVGTECAKFKYRMPVGFWYMNEDCLDPYHMLVESDRRKELTLANVLKGEGIAFLPTYAPHEDPEEDARLAAELIHRRFLFEDSAAEARLREILDKRLHAPAMPEVDEEAISIVDEEEETTEPEAEAEDEAEDEYEEVEEDDAEEEEDEEDSEEEGEFEDEEEEYEYEEEDEEEAPPPPPRAPAKPRKRRARQGN